MLFRTGQPRYRPFKRPINFGERLRLGCSLDNFWFERNLLQWVERFLNGYGTV